MWSKTRRDFLADVGRGMLVAGVGSTLAADLGLFTPRLDDDVDRLHFGALESLVCFMQDTPVERLQAAVIEKLTAGVSLETLVSAAALANARSFGGQDYDGYHTFMALGPALYMAREMPSRAAALPVLKVLYRNTNRIQTRGGGEHETLRPVTATSSPIPADAGAWLQSVTRSADMERAEGIFAALVNDSVGEAYNHLQFSVQDEVDVHRIVLAWRAWMMLDVTGMEHAHTLLRQSVRYCVQSEQQRLDRRHDPSGIRELLPRLLDEFRLLGRSLGAVDPGEIWISSAAEHVAMGSPETAARLAAGALAEGISSEAVGEAISLASMRLLLHDRGLNAQQASASRPVGSVHGASIGVHAADSANAWRNIARVSNHRNTVASLIVGAYHTAGRGNQVGSSALPYEEAAGEIADSDPQTLLRQLDDAVQANDQLQACAIVHHWGITGQQPQAIFARLLPYAVSEDGALHAEKFYRTVQEEFVATRPSLRWQHLVGLARVTASEFGNPAPGQTEARQLLGLE